MAWTAGAFWLAPGTSVGIAFDWDGQYQGTQFALAKPSNVPFGLLFQVPGDWEVETTEHRLRVRPRAEERRSSFWIYGVTVRNTGESAALFVLTGGEVQP